MNFLTATMLRDAAISFPMLGDLSLDPPYSFTVFGFEVYFYGAIIATGGGAVLNPLNIRALKRNSAVIFLDRPTECLLVTSDRPLSSSRTAIEKMFSERYEKYTGAADIRIDADATPESITDSLLKELKIG